MKSTKDPFDEIKYKRRARQGDQEAANELQRRGYILMPTQKILDSLSAALKVIGYKIECFDREGAFNGSFSEVISSGRSDDFTKVDSAFGTNFISLTQDCIVAVNVWFSKTEDISEFTIAGHMSECDKIAARAILNNFIEALKQELRTGG